MSNSNTTLGDIAVVDGLGQLQDIDQLITITGLKSPIVALQDKYVSGSITTGSSGITSTNTIQLAPQGCGALLVTVTPSTADMTFTFIGSTDGTTFAPIPAFPQDPVSGLFAAPVQKVLDLASAVTYYVPCAGYNVVGVTNSTTYGGEFTSGSVAITAEASTAPIPSIAFVPGTPNAFRGCVAAWTAANVLTTKDLMQLKGSSTKIVRLRRVGGTMLVDGTNVGSVNFWLNRRTATFTSSGTVAAVTCVANDIGAASSLNATQTAVLNTGTATVTNGAGTGLIAAKYVGDDATSALGGQTSADFLFDFSANPLVIRGTGDFVALGVGATGAPTTSLFDFFWEWDEASL